MSIHSSLRIAGKMAGQRNVWTRAERIAALRKLGRWQDGDRVLGLPKVRTRFRVKTKKAPKAEDGAAAAAPAVAEAAAAEPQKDKKEKKG
jgi:small basic protein (TIGR04137 family)